VAVAVPDVAGVRRVVPVAIPIGPVGERPVFIRLGGLEEKRPDMVDGPVEPLNVTSPAWL